MRQCRWVFALSASLLFAVLVGCTAMQEFSSSPDGEGDAVRHASDEADEERNQTFYDAWPMQDYVLDDTESLVLKVRPSAWSTMRNRLEAMGSSVSDTASGWIASHVGREIQLEAVDANRATYLMVESPANSPWMVCVDAGLPCPVLGSPAPLWGRLLVPAQRGRVEALAESLRQHLGAPERVRLVSHESYVRAEFVIGEGTESAWSKALDDRADYDPDARGVRETPAKQAFMNHEGAVAVYGGLRHFRYMERYIESLVWFRSVQNASPSQGWALALNARRGGFSGDSTRQRPADFEDLAVLVDGGSDSTGFRVDMAATRTRAGRTAVVEEGATPTFATDELSSLVNVLREMTSGLTRGMVEDIAGRIDDVAGQATVRRVSSGGETWAGLRLEVGGNSEDAVSRIELPGEALTLQQPGRNCLTRGADVVRPTMSGRLDSSGDFVRMANAVTAVSGTFERRMTECSGSEVIEQERIAWASAAFDMWRGLLAWRSGSTEWSNRLVGRSCDAGLAWACDVDRTMWPWVDSGPPTATSK